MYEVLKQHRRRGESSSTTPYRMFYRSTNEKATIVLVELRLSLIRSHPMPTFDNELAKNGVLTKFGELAAKR
jgi:hypothetical protein